MTHQWPYCAPLPFPPGLLHASALSGSDAAPGTDGGSQAGFQLGRPVLRPSWPRSGAVQAAHPGLGLLSPPTLALARNYGCLCRVRDRPRCESRCRRADTTPRPLLDVRRSAQAFRSCRGNTDWHSAVMVAHRGFLMLFGFTHGCLPVPWQRRQTPESRQARNRGKTAIW